MVYVKAAVLHAQKDYAGAAAALAEAKPITPATAGTLTWNNGRTARFLDLTDSERSDGAYPALLRAGDGARSAL